jgi:signal transduction histidine kinase
MQHALPRRIKLAFIVQALVASIVITAMTMLGATLVRATVVRNTLEREAAAFWTAPDGGLEHALPRGRTVTSYFAAPGAPQAALPHGLEDLPPGLHRVEQLPGRAVYIDQEARGRLTLVYDTRMLDAAILWSTLGSALLALVIGYGLSWWTYRTSKRLVGPVSWLAGVVARWDPRAPDIAAIRAHKLPAEAGDEVQALASALTGLADRVADFVQRERNFTRDASHELRTPLTVIRVATDLMLADPDANARQQRSLLRVQRASRDMEAVIDAFLILAREAEVEPVSEEFDVREIVAHEIERVQPMLVGRPIELGVTDDGAPHLFAPPHVLAVMVGNLLSNAVRFTDRGRIDLHLRRDRIEVRDTGIGMSPEAVARAFDPFYRADPLREDGRGMGLSIVRRLGERFGWPVSLVSTPGQGTTVEIRFGETRTAVDPA